MEYSINYKGHYHKFENKKELVHFLLQELWGEILDFAYAPDTSEEEGEHLNNAENLMLAIEGVIE